MTIPQEIKNQPDFDDSVALMTWEDAMKIAQYLLVLRGHRTSDDGTTIKVWLQFAKELRKQDEDLAKEAAKIRKRHVTHPVSASSEAAKIRVLP